MGIKKRAYDRIKRSTWWKRYVEKHGLLIKILYENGFNGQRLFLGKERSIFNQNSRSSLILNSVDGAILFKLYNKFSDAKKELKDIRIEVQNIILMLGTKLKVLKEFPEAESCFKDVNSKCTDVSICVSDIRKKIFTK
jgi:hypothetical protein